MRQSTDRCYNDAVRERLLLHVPHGTHGHTLVTVRAHDLCLAIEAADQQAAKARTAANLESRIRRALDFMKGL